MNRASRWLGIVLLLVLPMALAGESVKSLPAPTGYINDFAGVLSPSTKQEMETLCGQVDRQAHAQIAVVTIKTLDDDQTIEEFATELEDKWGVGNKEDRGVLMVLVMTPRRGRIEVGYGLEGILNDAKVGDIGRSMVPAANRGDYNTAVPLGVRQIAGIIAQDAGVTLSLPAHQYHRQGVGEQPASSESDPGSPGRRSNPSVAVFPGPHRQYGADLLPSRKPHGRRGKGRIPGRRRRPRRMGWRRRRWGRIWRFWRGKVGRGRG